MRKGATRALWERESRERDESQPYFQVAGGVPPVMSLFAWHLGIVTHLKQKQNGRCECFVIIGKELLFTLK